MASLTLCSTSVAKQHVSEERTSRHCQHDPSVICHEKKPMQTLVQASSGVYETVSHNEERVEHLYSIERSFDCLVLPIVASPAACFGCA